MKKNVFFFLCFLFVGKHVGWQYGGLRDSRPSFLLIFLLIYRCICLSFPTFFCLAVFFLVQNFSLLLENKLAGNPRRQYGDETRVHHFCNFFLRNRCICLSLLIFFCSCLPLVFSFAKFLWLENKLAGKQVGWKTRAGNTETPFHQLIHNNLRAWTTSNSFPSRLQLYYLSIKKYLVFFCVHTVPKLINNNLYAWTTSHSFTMFCS